jgi:hypothetical protein
MTAGDPADGARRRRLNRRSARRVAARRLARHQALRASAALTWMRHSFAVAERAGGAGTGNLSLKLKPDVCVSMDACVTDYLSLNSNLRTSFYRRTAASTSVAALTRADASVLTRCERYQKRCRPLRASDQGLAGPLPNGGAGDISRRAIALQALGLQPTSQSGAASAPAARAVVADRMSLPATAATVDLLSSLPPELRAVYSSAAPTAWVEGSGIRTAAPPKPCSLVSGCEMRRLVARMWSAGMLVFLTTVQAVCGFFAVDKSDGRLRLITDARPANWHFALPQSVSLPTPDLLARIIIPSGVIAFVARTDVADFYHLFRVPGWLQRFFGLPPVRVCDLPAAARVGLTGEWVYPALTTLPMGYSHAVLLAQAAHLHVFDQMPDLFPKCNRIGDPECTDMTLRPGRVLYAVCIDDVLFFGVDEQLVALRQRQYLAAGRRAGFVYKPEKTVAPTADGAPVLGLEFNGRAGTLCLSAEKMERLVAATRAAVADGHMRAVDLQSLVGHWVWAMLPRRPALSIFSAVFALTNSKRRGTVALWPSVKRELLVAADIAPLLVARLSAPKFPLTVVSDASSTGLGVVAVKRVAGVAPAGTTVAGVNGVVATPVPADAVIPVVASRWRWPEHINVLEFRAAHVALRWVLRHALPGGVRVPLWSDSSVVIGVLRKGRSCSTALNRRMRALASDLLRADVSVEVDWIESALNPADAPSRS